MNVLFLSTICKCNSKKSFCQVHFSRTEYQSVLSPTQKRVERAFSFAKSFLMIDDFANCYIFRILNYNFNFVADCLYLKKNHIKGQYRIKLCHPPKMDRLSSSLTLYKDCVKLHLKKNFFSRYKI